MMCLRGATVDFSIDDGANGEEFANVDDDETIDEAPGVL